MVCSPHGFIIHWIVISKNIKKVTEVVDVGRQFSGVVVDYFFDRMELFCFVGEVFDSEYVWVQAKCPWHATGKCTEPGKMQHPVDGRAWKNFDTKYLDFIKEPRNVRLGLAVDSFNPFSNLKVVYLGGWPALHVMKTLHLPWWLGKTLMIGHKRFLKKPHIWRRSHDFNGEIEDGDPPRKFDQVDIMAQLVRLPTRVKGKHPMYGGVKIKRNVLVDLN
ncbi:gag-pol polyprotein [Tanacetum coccineum]